MRLFVTSVFAISGLAFAAQAHAGAYNEMNPSQQAQVQAGQQVVVTHDISSSPWPAVTIYQRVDATPEDSVAVFSDYNLQRTFIKNLIKSQISQVINPSLVMIDYTLSLPFGMQENYTVRDQISSYDGGSSFRVDWRLDHADTVVDTIGNCRFEALGTGTLMAYYNFVTPGDSVLNGALKGQALKQVQDTTQAFVNQIQNERKGNQGLLQQQLQALHRALGN